MTKKTLCLTVAILITLTLFSFEPNKAKAQDKTSMFTNNWPQWRGLYNTGAAFKGNPPTEFSETKNVKWKIEIPGKGHATPIVWGDQVIIQTSIPTNKKPENAPSQPAQAARGGMPSGPKAEFIHQFVVISVNKNTGKINWQTVVKEEFPLEGTHELGSWASNSPVTDGEFIYAYFGSRGLYCLDFNGKVIWGRDFGQMEIAMNFGEGSSPAVYKDKLFIQWDNEKPSFIYAIDKKTGKDVWVKEREEKSSWATPLVVEVNGKAQVITAASKKVRSYDAETGDIVWELSGLTGNVIPDPIYSDGIVYLMSGFRGTALKAVDLAKAKGNITGTGAVLWEYNQDTPYTPAAVLMDGKLYFLRNNNGILTCLDAKTGKPYYSNQKIETIGTLYSSPTGANGKLYIAAQGSVTVIKAGAEYSVLANNPIDDNFHASPVVVGDQLFLRGFKNLYCISEK
jgi:outer membrane protein assembly factor BamB